MNFDFKRKTHQEGLQVYFVWIHTWIIIEVLVFSKSMALPLKLKILLFQMKLCNNFRLILKIATLFSPGSVKHYIHRTSRNKLNKLKKTLKLLVIGCFLFKIHLNSLALKVTCLTLFLTIPTVDLDSFLTNYILT